MLDDLEDLEDDDAWNFNKKDDKNKKDDSTKLLDNKKPEAKSNPFD
jgi:hypothetical protein